MSIIMATDSDENKINLFLVNGNVFVWNASDACRLREEHRIVGSLSGCLPRLPQQNNQLGLPLHLLNEEARLLIEKGIGRLLDDSKPLSQPSDGDIEWFKQLREKQYKEQIELYREERRDEMRRHLPKIIEGQRAKKQKLMDSVKGSESSSDPHDSEDEKSFDVESVEIPPISMQHSMVQLFTETQRRQPMEAIASWIYPSSGKDILHYRVFKDLWDRGYYLTSGFKFGGDFLVYPGDPSLYHAYFVAICLPFKSKMVALDIVSMGRLGANVKKIVLICSLDKDNDSVIYTSLNWTGIS